jgi:hypothetical protein
MRRRKLPWVGTGFSIIALSLVSRPDVRAIDVVDEGCPLTSGPTEHQGSTLQSFATAGTGGVVYDGSDSSLRLNKEGGIFSSSVFPAAGTPQYACPADFDEDGWIDFIGGTADGRNIGFFRNRTANNLAAYPPNWTDPAYVLPPLFERPLNAWFWTSATTISGGGATACGDFDNDGNADFALVMENGDNGGPAEFGKLFRGNGNGTFQAATDLTPSVPTDFAELMWDGNMVATDYNGDGWQDLLFGADDAGGGFVRVFLNDKANPPGFTPSSFLVQSAGMGASGVQGVAWQDFTGDGREDLVIAGLSTTKIQLYPGLAGGGVSATAQLINSHLGQTILLGADYSLDGKTDLIMATNANGGRVYYYKNNGTATPFSDGVTQILTESFSDFDTGFLFNYDNDPDASMDLMLADGNGAGYATFANRVLATFVACGDVASGILDLGDLDDEEMVVTAARLSPTMVLPSGTSISFYMSNEDPADWQLANACVDDITDYCVQFPHPVGRTVRWKATMCANGTRTATPRISEIEIHYDYTLAEEHFRGGVVVDDGVAYVGAFRQPGDRGHFYATNAGLTEVYWDAGVKLDGMNDSDRTIYTATVAGTDRLDFRASSASDANLRATLGVASAAQAQSVITWQRSARFGIAGGGVQKTKLGAVETSTPAVISPPGRPLWYPHLSSTEKQKVDVFIQQHHDRPLLALFGSKDGPLHAVRNDPSDIADPTNGTEAWAFIPARVAAGLVADQANSAATSFVDGSPTLADVKLADGTYHTVAVVSGGNGSSSVFALDVTDTINPSSGAVIGPDPLWEVLPGDELAGQGRAKPAVARVRIAGVEKFIAILATGMARDDTTPPYSKGRDVIAVDITTGERMWRFRAACPVTSDPVVFETDDEAEPGSPALDGYADRVVLADACGYVYKLDPAVKLPGNGAADGWLDSSALGAITTGETDPAGQGIEALFSSRLTDGALGGDRPITGTIGSRADVSGRVVLFFGTGGMESLDPALRNEFYAIYADSGVIREKIIGECSNNSCEKFYGGVVVSSDQVLLTRATDPPIGTDTCDLGGSQLSGVDIDDLSTVLTVNTASATVSSLFGHAGAVYFTTLSGDLVRVGTPVASEAGGESGGNGNGNGDGNGSEHISNALGILGWRQVL